MGLIDEFDGTEVEAISTQDRIGFPGGSRVWPGLVDPPRTDEEFVAEGGRGWATAGITKLAGEPGVLFWRLSSDTHARSWRECGSQAGMNVGGVVFNAG